MKCLYASMKMAVIYSFTGFFEEKFVYVLSGNHFFFHLSFFIRMRIAIHPTVDIIIARNTFWKNISYYQALKILLTIEENPFKNVFICIFAAIGWISNGFIKAPPKKYKFGSRGFKSKFSFSKDDVWWDKRKDRKIMFTA